ncbi:MAG: hypothetical protein ACLUSW_07305 [Faecalibacterium sp.]
MSGLAGQTSLFPPEPAPDPLLCWLWLAHVLGPASVHAGRVLDAFGGAQEAWEARDTAEFRLAAGRQQLCGRSSWPRNSTTRW